MQVKEIYKGLYLFTFPNQFELTSHFFRLQEFYESPINKIKGKYFNYEDAISLYAYNDKDEPEFTYFKDWSGFNVPGNAVDKFVNTFDEKMTDKELTVTSTDLIDTKKKYYIIGVYENDKGNAIEHEIAHGLYYLNRKYKKEVSKAYKALPKKLKEKIKKELLSIGYCYRVVQDETHAYLATGVRRGMLNPLDYILHWSKIRKFKIIFDKYIEEVNYE